MSMSYRTHKVCMGGGWGVSRMSLVKHKSQSPHLRGGFGYKSLTKMLRRDDLLPSRITPNLTINFWFFFFLYFFFLFEESLLTPPRHFFYGCNIDSGLIFLT